MDKPLVQEILDDLEDLPEDKLDQVKDYVRTIKAQTPMAGPKIPKPGLDARGLFIVWRCTNCGHLFLPEDKIPDRCPDCGAPKEEFVLEEED